MTSSAPQERPLRVGLCGVGAMGRAIGRALVSRGHSIVAAIDPGFEGQALTFDGAGSATQITTGGSVSELLSGSPDVVVHATPRDGDLISQLLELVEGGVDVASISGIAGLWATNPEGARTLDEAARRNDVRVLGTGSNPGFLLDLTPLFLSGACTRVDSVRASRVADLTPFGVSVCEMYGLGLDPPEFTERVQSGQLGLHKELEDSVGIIAQTLEWSIESLRQERAPIIAQSQRAGDYFTVPEGKVCGFRQVVIADRRDSKGAIRLELAGIIDPQPSEDGFEVDTRVSLVGVPSMDIVMTGEVARQAGDLTVARVVNVLPWLVSTHHRGIVPFGDIPVSAPAREAGKAAFMST